MNPLEPARSDRPTAAPGPFTGRLIAAYLLFVAIVCAYTYPLVLKPGSYLRGFNDPYLFTWMLAWVSKTLFTDPLSLFDTNIFFPYANTLAFSEPLILPAATIAAPVYALSGNPILAYNVTLVLFQALCGWSAYYVARRITGSETGAVLAGIVYCVSPFRIGYYNFLNIHLSFAVPLAVLAFVLFLERQQYRYLAATLVLVWLQAITIWYGGIPLALLLGLVALGFLLLRPRGWRLRTPLALALGGVVLLIALLPVAWPYLQVARELGFERSLADVNHYRADLLSFLDAGRDHLFYDLADSTRYPGLFPGFTAYALAALALLSASLGGARGTGGRLLAAATWLVPALLVATVLLLVNGEQALSFLSRDAALSTLKYLVWGVLLLGLAWLAVRGRSWWRGEGSPDRALTTRDWSILLGVLAFFCVLLTLGPVMHLQGEPFGTGVYAYVYEFFPGFSAIRISLRLAFLALFLLGVLAAFGVALLESRFRASRGSRVAVYALPVLLLIEYLPGPLTYHDIDWEEPPEVYRWLASQDGDFAVLEFPTKDERIDSTYVFWSLYHGKRLVTGVSGFYPPLSAQVAYSLADLPVSGDVGEIRSIYGLRYVLIHPEWMNDDYEREAWLAVEDHPPSGLQKVGEFGGVVVFEVDRHASGRWKWVRNLPTEWVSASPEAEFSIRTPDSDREVRHYVDVEFNGERLTRLDNVADGSAHRIKLPRPYHDVRPNRLVLDGRYRITAPTEGRSEYRIGETDTYSPADIVVSSAGKPYGSSAAIWVNGQNHELPRYRGYSVAVIDPDTGELVQRSAFDTRRGAAESKRLVDFFDRVPTGHIVAVALNRAGGGQLSDAAVQAFRSVGGGRDPREHAPYSSHVLIGAKGAAPGTAVEEIAGRPITRVVGVDRRERTMTVVNFHLVPGERRALATAGGRSD